MEIEEIKQKIIKELNKFTGSEQLHTRQCAERIMALIPVAPTVTEWVSKDKGECSNCACANCSKIRQSR